MTLDASIMLAGAIVALLPFLGFPISWQKPILFVAGVSVVFMGIVVRRRLARRSTLKNIPHPPASDVFAGHDGTGT